MSGYFNGDILTQFMPLYTEVAARLKDGDLPGWNPALLSGMPLAGDPISGWGYLPAMGFFALFGPLGAYQVHVYFHLALAGVATFFLGRRLGMGVMGALVAAIAYELGPHAYFTKCCTARMQLGPWIPLGLLAVELGVRSRSWTGRLLSWGAAGAIISQIIAGYFGKGAYYGILTIAAYAAYRTLLRPAGATSVAATHRCRADALRRNSRSWDSPSPPSPYCPVWTSWSERTWRAEATRRSLPTSPPRRAGRSDAPLRTSSTLPTSSTTSAPRPSRLPSRGWCSPVGAMPPHSSPSSPSVS